MPVQLVQTAQDFERYTDIWLPSWIENGYELESYITPGIERYIFFDERGDYASLEIVPYNFEFSPVNQSFPFNQFTRLKGKKIVEIDKFSIKKEKQSIKKLHELMSFVTYYLIHNNFDYGLTLLNPQVYETLVWRFKVPITKLAVPNMEIPLYVPALINVKELKNSPSYKVLSKKFQKAQ